MKQIALITAVVALCLFAPIVQAVDWATTQRLTWASGVSEDPAMAVDSTGSLHLVWHDNAPGNYEIYHKKSANGGAAWTASRRLMWTSGASTHPALAAGAAGSLHLFWEDNTAGNYEIYYKRSTDGGATWSANQRLTWTAGHSLCPAVAVGPSGHLHLVWEDSTPGNAEIYYKKSTNAGATWSTSQRLTWTAGYSGQAAVAVDSSGYLHLIWQDDTPGNHEIYYKKSANGGATWTASQRFTWTSGASSHPAVAAGASGSLHLLWEDNSPGNFEIYYKKSVNGGVTWSTNQRLTWTGGYSELPAVALDSSGQIHLTWQDNTPGNYEIYHKGSTDGGASWTASQRLIWTAGNSSGPALAADASGRLHVTWYDLTPGNKEIYHRKGTTVSLTPITSYPSYDNTVCYSSAIPEYANTVYSNSQLGVGYDYFTSLVGWDFLLRASTIKFDVQAQISGRTISKATLRLYVYTLRGDFSITPQIRLNALATDWNPNTLTYNIFEGMQRYLAGEVVKEAPFSWSVPFDFDVTTIVQNWASGAWPNYGFLLYPEGHNYPGGPSLQGTLFQSLEYYYDANQRPQLLIEFQ